MAFLYPDDHASTHITPNDNITARIQDMFDIRPSESSVRVLALKSFSQIQYHPGTRLG
jgi:hypothetical protein